MKLDKYDYLVGYLLLGVLAYLILNVVVTALTKGCLS